MIRVVSHTRKDRTAKRTFSMYENILYGLEKESARRNSNPSALLNQILAKWLTFDAPLEKIDPVTFTRHCVEALISKMDTDTLREIARDQATRNFGSLLSLFHGNLSISSIIESYYDNFGKYSGWYSFSCENIRNLYRLTFHHTKGLKWSQFIAEYNQIILERVSERVECHVDNNVVVFTIIPKQKVIVDY
ncbi:MAG: hypothetical protein KGL95_01840, partial [Patescibacteria group bacterium]|nr:hypothetical protein [Patescibacteria group bacterium]